MLILQELRPWVAEVARRAGLQGMRTLLDKKVGYLSVGSNADNATIAIDGMFRISGPENVLNLWPMLRLAGTIAGPRRHPGSSFVGHAANVPKRWHRAGPENASQRSRSLRGR